MSFKALDCWTIICDWPDCGEDLMDPTDYSGWGDQEYLIEQTGESGWWIAVDGSHYCSKHLATWASDYENGEPFPEPPYLLIHDGDTDNPDDDGKVSLIDGVIAQIRGVTRHHTVADTLAAEDRVRAEDGHIGGRL